MTSVTIAAWAGAGNLGDELILRALLRRLDEFGVVDVTVLSMDVERTGADHGVRAIHHLDVVGLSRRLRAGGGLVFGGGGLLQDATSLLSPIYQTARPLIGAAWHRPVGVVGLGVEPLRARTSRRLARAVGARAVGIAVRDQASADVLRGLGVEDVTVAGDLALTLPPPAGDADDALAVCLRPTFAEGGVLPGRWRREQTDAGPYLDAMTRALEAVRSRTGLALRLVGFEAHRDGPFLSRLADRLAGDVEVVLPTLDTILPTLRATRAVVATRYHGAVGATVAGRPAVLLGYAPKVASLAGQLQGSDRYLSNETSALAGLPTAVDRALEVTDADVAETRRTLSVLAHRNDEVLERLLEHL